MPSKPPQIVRWLKDILENIALAQSFVGELEREVFCADKLRVYGVTRCLEIISEASRRLPGGLKARHPSIPWKEMAGAGNVYRHDYEEVDADEVWVTVQDLLLAVCFIGVPVNYLFYYLRAKSLFRQALLQG